MFNDFFNGLKISLYPNFILYLVLIIIILSKLNIGKSSLTKFILSFVLLFIIGFYILNVLIGTGAYFLFYVEFVLSILIVIFLIWFLLTKTFSSIGKIFLLAIPLIVFSLKLSSFSVNCYSPEIEYDELSEKIVNRNNLQEFIMFITAQISLISAFIFLGVQQIGKYEGKSLLNILKLIITIFVLLSSMFTILYSLMIIGTKALPNS